MDFSKLNDERDNLIAKSEADVAKAVAEGKYADEAKAEFAKAKARIDEIDALVADAKSAAANKFKSGKVKDTSKFDETPVDSVDVKQAFNTFLQTGDRAQFTLTSNVPNNSGAAVNQTGTVPIPQIILAPLVQRRWGNKVRQAITENGGQIYSSPNPIATAALPLFDDTMNIAERLGEGQNGSKADPALTGGLLLPKLYSSKQTWQSNTSVYGNPELADQIIPAHYKRLDRKQENDWFDQIKSAATLSYQMTAANLTYATYGDFVDLMPVEYRDDVVLFVSGYGLKLFRTIADTTGRPIFTDPVTGVVSIDGYKVYPVAGLDGSGLSKTVGVLASVECLVAYDAGPDRVKVYVDDPDHEDQTGYQIFRNGDFYAHPAGLVKLITKAT